MTKIIVTDPRGILLGSDRLAKGSQVPSGVSGSQLAAWKRFGQVKEVEEKAPKGSGPPPPTDPPQDPPPTGEEDPQKTDLI